MASQRGISESTQWALIAPLVLLTVLGLIQVGIVLHARNIVRQAAMAAAESEAMLGARSGDADAVVSRITGPADLEAVNTTVTRERDVVTVVVTGRAQVFFDIGVARVEGRAVMPVEQP